MLARLLICCTLPCAALAEAGLNLHVTGAAQTVFAWERDRCATWDIPDAPTRAWRSEDGSVALLSGSEATRVSRGKTLDAITRDCHVVHQGAENDDPAAWDDRTWIASVHTEDGRNMIALGHVEYHGHLRPESCPSGSYPACWFNSVIELRSDDGGRNFRRLGDGADLVAALPQLYRGEEAHRTGFFNPSNIVSHDGHLYAFIFAEAAGPQRRGPCLIRRPVGGGPADWRAWNGTGFTVRFRDPYRVPGILPSEQACRPVSGLRSTISSVVKDQRTGHFVAVTPTRAEDGTVGIFWSSSTDLVQWSQPSLLVAVPLLWERDCAQPAAYAYPSLIDPDSPSRVFDSTDDDLWLYLTRMPLDATCAVTAHRDLIRLPVRLHDAAPLP